MGSAHGVSSNAPESAVLAAGLDARSLDFNEIPAIDLSGFLDGTDKRGVADRIGVACRDIGFFYVTGHGIPATRVEETFAQCRRFFALPEARKMAIHIARSRAHRGYYPLFEENTDPALTADLKEGFDIARELAADHPDVIAGKPLHGPNQWPADLDGFRATSERYYAEMIGLANALMRAIALSLDLDEHYFAAKTDAPLAQLRMLHYPPQAGHIAHATLGCGAHTDYGCLTILAQDSIPGLQIRNAAGEWIAAPPLPGSLVINLGDQLARWTNDLFKATPHRVINASGAERYSLPFFFDPNWDARVECLATCQDPQHPPKYEPVLAGPYLLSRFEATYNYLRDATSAEQQA